MELLCQVNNLSLGKKPKNYLPESNENDFNSLKLKRGGEATTLHDNEGEKGGWIHPENDNVIYGEPLKVVWLPGKQRESTKTIIL